MNIEKLGFNKWFHERTDSAKLTDYQIARVITVNKESYIINNGKKDALMMIPLRSFMTFFQENPY